MKNLRKFNERKGLILHWGMNSPMHKYMLKNTQLEKILAEKGLGSWWPSSWTWHSKGLCRKENQYYPGMHEAKYWQKVKGHDPLHSALARLYLGCWVRFWAPNYKRDTSILETPQKRAMKMLKALGYLVCDKRQRKLGLENRKLKKILLMYINT